MAAPSSAWIRALPKAEVHLHLEGCVQHDLVRAAARRQGVSVAAESPVIASLAELLAYLDVSCGLIDRGDDLHAIAYGAAKRANASGAQHIDVIANPTHWRHFSGRLDAFVDALDAGFDDAETDGLATATVCLSLKRNQSASEAEELVDWIIERRHPRISALSIDGNEADGSNTARFVEPFRRAGEAGLRRCAHAGESSGAGGVREAIDLLGAERIDHGIRAIEDPELLRELADRQIPLDVCPTSNVVLGVSPGLERHPIDQLRRAGVAVSINTDDPLLYGIDLAGEYGAVATTFSWGHTDLVEVAATSIASTFADADRRAELLGNLSRFASSATDVDDLVTPSSSKGP